jgi:hypothetical protein
LPVYSAVGLGLRWTDDLDALKCFMMPPWVDTDTDGMPDYYENQHWCLNPLVPDWGGDPDADLLTNGTEMYSPGLDPCVNDTDGDGCADSEEPAGQPVPKPGSTGAYNPKFYWDYFDVPVPANKDPVANGVRNGAMSLGDVGAVLFYVGASPTGICGDNLNGNGVDYDCDKNGNAVADGVDYDRTPSAAPNPPWEAGLPNSAISLADVGGTLAQVGLDCTGAP